MAKLKTNRINWNPEDPATPALIEPMLYDSYECEDCPKWNSPEFQKAFKSAAEYCNVTIKFFQNEEIGALTMSEMDSAVTHFIHGYMAALTGEIKYD